MAELNEQQNHLAQVLQQQQTIVQEINNLNREVENKRQMALKLQGVAEYLDQIGIKLPEPETSPTSEDGDGSESVEPEVETPTVVTE
tara:strand:- start:225 stop:485 length:261 start_codon:yes stop_codon:yes gene_type:complete